MSRVPRWQLGLIVIPVAGVLLAFAWLLDAFLDEQPAEPLTPESDDPADQRPAPPGRRLCAGLIDLLPLFGLAALLPPAFAWALGSAYLLFRDGGTRPFSLGKRALGLRARAGSDRGLSYVESFSRNLPLLLPYAGLLVEVACIARGAPRLGDRLAETRVIEVPPAS